MPKKKLPQTIEECNAELEHTQKQFRAVMEQKLRLSSEAAIRRHKKRLAQDEKRLGELDRLFIRIYEDNVAGRITDEKFSINNKVVGCQLLGAFRLELFGDFFFRVITVLLSLQNWLAKAT